MAYKDMPVAEILHRLRFVEEVGLYYQFDTGLALASDTVSQRGSADECAEFEAMRARCLVAMEHVAIHGYRSLEKQDHPFIQEINRIRGWRATVAVSHA